MHLKIHNEGWVYLISSIILTIITFPFFPIIGILLFLLSFGFFYFFRDPIRSVPTDKVIISPADGQIVSISESLPPKECNVTGEYNKISIFLSIFNVHVNRIPISGYVTKINYIPGKFFNANLDKTSNENERNIIVVENDNKDKIIFSQIAGLIARRIVCDLKVNQEVVKGNRFGIIKFGSRVDLYLPKKFNLLVSVGQIVIGGETIISNPNNILKIDKTKKI